jgi:hypothetical protein
MLKNIIRKTSLNLRQKTWSRSKIDFNEIKELGRAESFSKHLKSILANKLLDESKIPAGGIGDVEFETSAEFQDYLKKIKEKQKNDNKKSR